MPHPAGIDPADAAAWLRWLTAFPSYGFVLSVAPQQRDAVCARFASRGIAAAVVGEVTTGHEVVLRRPHETARLWDFGAEPFITASAAMRRMKIALLTHSTLPRGGVVHVLELGQALHRRGHAVTVFAPAAAGQRMFRASPCRIVLAELAGGARGFADGVRRRIDALRDGLALTLASEHFDVFHAHDGIGANALADLAAAGQLPGYLRTVHHVDRFADAQVQAWEERSIRAASRVLCVSALWQQRLLTTLGIEALRVNNGVDLDRFAPQADAHDAVLAAQLGLPPRGARVLAVGGIEARKNTRRLLAAFVRLRASRPDACLVIAGGASLLPHDDEVTLFQADLQAAGLRAGPGGPVVLTGPVDDAQMAALYRSADVLAMPSLLEGFGLAALEALACGTPAVVSALAPFTEHFGDADVHWADPLQPASIAAALERALQAGRHAQPPAVCARYAWTASAARHEAIYTDFVESDRSTPCPRCTTGCAGRMTASSPATRPRS